MPVSQAGFWSKRSCMDDIFSLFPGVHLQLRFKKRKVYAIFFYFKRALDLIQYASFKRSITLLPWKSKRKVTTVTRSKLQREFYGGNLKPHSIYRIHFRYGKFFQKQKSRQFNWLDMYSWWWLDSRNRGRVKWTIEWKMWLEWFDHVIDREWSYGFCRFVDWAWKKSPYS